jgi:hypothetical protein
MNTIERMKLAQTAEFSRSVQAIIVGIATGITYEDPMTLNFGTAHERIVATGRLLEAQLEAHKLRHSFSLQILTASDNMAPQFARGTAVILVDELARRGMVPQSELAEALCQKILSGEPLTATEQGQLDGLLYAVISHGFTSLSRFNAHAWGIEYVAP